MKGKKTAVFWILAAGIILLAVFFVIESGNPVRRNKRRLKECMEQLASMESGSRISLSAITPFLWDTVYSFDPYTSAEEMAAVMNTSERELQETVNEGMTQLIFLREGKIAAVICGYAENLGYDIDLGLWEDGKNYRKVERQTDSFTLYTETGYPRLVFEGESFQGIIRELGEDGTALVEIEPGYPICGSGNQVYVSLPEALHDGAKAGSRVEVTYDGRVAETFPLQLPGQMRVRLCHDREAAAGEAWTEEKIQSVFVGAGGCREEDILDCVPVWDYAFERVGVVMFAGEEAQKVSFAFIDEEGEGQNCALLAGPAEDPELTYLGNGTVSCRMESEANKIYTTKLTFSISEGEICFKAEDDLADPDMISGQESEER